MRDSDFSRPHRGNSKDRVIYCLNRFFGGLGGEDKAYQPPQFINAPQGPGIFLEKLFPDIQITATLVVGDNYLAVRAPLFEAEDDDKPHVLFAGPAFNPYISQVEVAADALSI